MPKFTVPLALRKVSAGALGAAVLTVGMTIAPAAQADALPAPMPQCGGGALNIWTPEFSMNLGNGCFGRPVHYGSPYHDRPIDRPWPGHGCGDRGCGHDSIRENAQWRWCSDGPRRRGERFLETDAGAIWVYDRYPGRHLGVDYLQHGMVVYWR